MTTRLPLPERLRPKTIRAKVVVLLTVPVVSLMALWGYAAVGTASQVSAAQQLRDINTTLTTPIRDLTGAVEDERTAALVYRAAPNSADRTALDGAEQRTDRAVAALRSGVDRSSTDTAALDSDLPARINALMSSAGSLAAGRSGHGAADLASGYDRTVERAFSVQAGLADAAGAKQSGDARAVLELARAREALSRQDGDFRAAQAAGVLQQPQYLDFVRQSAVQQSLTEGALPDLSAQDSAGYRAVLDSAASASLAKAQQAISAAGAGGALTAVPADYWSAAAGSTLSGLGQAEAAAEARGASAGPYSFSVLGGSGLAVVLGLLGVICSLVLSVRVGRGLVTDLTGLRNTALQLASSRLPGAIRRIHNGEELDVEAEAPLADSEAGRSEVGQVAAALNTVHRAALRAVAGRAAALTGVSGVYVGLARRSQVLLHKQLDLLDTMERRTEDPAELEDLFKLDHLTTRMRRHAESLLILSGSAPGRAWRNPVPLLDAVRAGAAETADLSRVRIESVPQLWLDGSAVADLVHLIAELTENAAAFSPPHTQVAIRGDEVGTGAVLEIEDRGLGMSDAALRAANERIGAEEVNLLDSRQLGLFVVNRLAQRLDMRVTLRHSVYGGVCAVIFIPKDRLGALHPGLAETASGAGPGGRSAGAGEGRAMLPRYARGVGEARSAVPQGASARGLRFPEAHTRAPGATSAPAPASTPAPAPAPAPGGGAHRAAATGATASAHSVPRPRHAGQHAAETPGTGSASARPGTVQPATAEAAPSGGAPTEAAPAAAADAQGLPQRVRQASLAPELRRTGQQGGPDQPDTAGGQQSRPAAYRSPEAARATISSLRSGRRRARAAGANPGAGAATGADAGAGAATGASAPAEQSRSAEAHRGNRTTDPNRAPARAGPRQGKTSERAVHHHPPERSGPGSRQRFRQRLRRRRRLAPRRPGLPGRRGPLRRDALLGRPGGRRLGRDGPRRGRAVLRHRLRLPLPGEGRRTALPGGRRHPDDGRAGVRLPLRGGRRGRLLPRRLHPRQRRHRPDRLRDGRPGRAGRRAPRRPRPDGRRAVSEEVSDGGGPASGDEWRDRYDEEAGPLVRLYAMTAGRARPPDSAGRIGLMAIVQPTGERPPGFLPPEQRDLLRLCGDAPQPVADLASDSGLPVGVVRVLLGELVTHGLVRITPPEAESPSHRPDARLLRDVINGLRAL